MVTALDAYAATDPERIHIFASLGQLRYLSALRHADVVVGNSSSGLIEAPALQTPTVNVGIRQRGRLRAASVIDCAEDAQAMGLGGGADAVGAVLVTAGLMIGVYAIIETAEYGWISTHTIAVSLSAVVLLTAFIVHETRVSAPLLPLHVLRSRDVSGANVIQALTVAAILGMFFVGVLYLQRVLGYSAMQVGVAFLPVAMTVGTFSLGFSARLNMRFGARAVLVVGLIVLASGLAGMARLPVNGEYVSDVLPAMVLMGIGAGVSLPLLMTLAMSGATPDDSGLASGLANTTAQVGGALGVAVLATVASSRTQHLLADGYDTASALTGGYQLAFSLGAGFVLTATVVALTVLRPAAGSRGSRHVHLSRDDWNRPWRLSSERFTRERCWNSSVRRRRRSECRSAKRAPTTGQRSASWTACSWLSTADRS